MTCDLPEIMAPHNKKTKLILLIKHRRKMMRRHAQSRRKLQGMWCNKQQIVMARYHQLMMSLMLNAAVIFSLYSLAKNRSQWARLRPGQWLEVVWETPNFTNLPRVVQRTYMYAEFAPHASNNIKNHCLFTTTVAPPLHLS